MTVKSPKATTPASRSLQPRTALPPAQGRDRRRDSRKQRKDAFELKPGAPAVAADVLAGGRASADSAWKIEGYAFAKVDPPVAHEDPGRSGARCQLPRRPPAPAVQIGEIRFRGLKRMHENFVRKRLLVHSGEQYGASKIERPARTCWRIGVFSSVSVQMGTAADSDGRGADHLPGARAAAACRERERRLFQRSGRQHRRHLDRSRPLGQGGPAHFSATAINLGGGTATNGIGYDLSAKYLMPDWAHRDQSLQTGVGALNQSLEAYDQTALTFGVTEPQALEYLERAAPASHYEEERIVASTNASWPELHAAGDDCVRQPPPRA